MRIETGSTKVIVNFIQHQSQELSLMYIEDCLSSLTRNEETFQKSYEKGKADILTDLSRDLSTLLGVSLSTTTYSDFLNQIHTTFSQKPASSMLHLVNCDLFDLYKLIQDTKRIISSAEQKLSFQGRLKLKQLKINIKVSNSDFLESEKSQLAEVFKELYNVDLDENVALYITSLQQEISQLRTTEFVDFYHFDEDLPEDLGTFDEPFDFSGPSSMTSQELVTHKYIAQQQKLIKDKEWEKLEAQRLKEKYRNKKNRFRIKAQEALEYEKSLRRKNLDIEREKQELERLKDAYYKEKKRISAGYEMRLRGLSEAISEISTRFESFDSFNRSDPITETEMISDCSYITESDNSFEASAISESSLSSIQKKIAELEAQYKASSPNAQEKILKELDVYKTNLSVLKSSQALKNSQSYQKKFNFLRNTQSVVVEPAKPSALMFSPRLRLSTGIPTKPIYTPKGYSHQFSFNDICPRTLDHEDNDLRKYLKVQKVKLEEREDKLERDKERWMQNWNKLPNASELIPMVGAELMELRKIKAELCRKSEDFEGRELEMNVKMEEIRVQEKELGVKVRELRDLQERFGEEKGNLIQRLMKLKEDLER